ncbi:TBC1D2 [Symbiodinium sp. CCMP2456]|nr:TBC1D2 [Symbiodinium sp. CCMP2456]
MVTLPVTMAGCRPGPGPGPGGPGDGLESEQALQAQAPAGRRSRRQRVRERLSALTMWLTVKTEPSNSGGTAESATPQAPPSPASPASARASLETPPASPTSDPEALWQDLWESISASGFRDERSAMSHACEMWRRPSKKSFWSRFARAGPSQAQHRDWERVSMAVRAGVPQALRCAVWTTCSGATGKKTKVASELGQEADVLYPSFVSQGLSLRNEASGVIDVDVPRTGCVEALLEPLRRVLLAFAAKNPQIGYCQSMNFIVATLLECCDEESAFWILCSLVEDMLPENYYTRNMIGVRVDMMVLNSLVMRHLPTLHAHFVEHEVDLSPFTMGWFLCLYVNTVPNPSLHRVLDCLLHEGSKVLFRTALAILHGLEPFLLNAKSLAKVYELLRCPSCPEAELLNTMYGSWLNCLSMDSVVDLRSQHLKDVLEQDAMVEARRAELRARREIDGPGIPGPGLVVPVNTGSDESLSPLRNLESLTFPSRVLGASDVSIFRSSQSRTEVACACFPNMAPAARGRERGQFAKGFLATLLVAALWAASSAVSGAVTFVTGAVRSTPDARSLVAREGGRDWHAGNVMKKIDFKAAAAQAQARKKKKGEKGDGKKEVIERPKRFESSPVYYKGEQVATLNGTMSEFKVDIWSGAHPAWQGKKGKVLLDNSALTKFQEKFGMAADVYGEQGMEQVKANEELKKKQEEMAAQGLKVY